MATLRADSRVRRPLEKLDENGISKKVDGVKRAPFSDLSNVARAGKGIEKPAPAESPPLTQSSARTSGASFGSAHSAATELDDWVMDLPEADRVDAHDPQAVAEYARDIYRYLKEREVVARVGDYMSQQEDLTEKMRAILVDWLVEVHWKFKLTEETLFATVHLLDTFLSRKQVKRVKLQLVGVTCMLLAAKHEEIYPPEIKDFVHVTDRAYSRDDILEQEVGILNTLHFELTHPSPLQFLSRFLKLQPGGRISGEHQALAEYALELSLVHYKSIRHAPSHSAAASLLLANKVLKVTPAWPPALILATGFTETQIKSCAKEMCALLQEAEKASLQAVRKKFSHPQFHRVAKMVA